MDGTEKYRQEHAQRHISYSRVLSLSREIHPESPVWPGDPQVEFQTVSKLHTHGYFFRRFGMGEHSGTHLNAPNSFHASGDSVDQYPAESLVSLAVVVDVTEKVKANPDYALTVDDLTQWEARNGLVATGTVVLLQTGWQEKWSSADQYLGAGTDGGLHFPGFGAEAVRFLLDDRGAGGIGTDTPGVEPGIDSDFTVNRIALEQRRIVLENLWNLDQLPATGTTLVIGILLLRGGTGSPASVLAFLP